MGVTEGNRSMAFCKVMGNPRVIARKGGLVPVIKGTHAWDAIRIFPTVSVSEGVDLLGCGDQLANIGAGCGAGGLEERR